MSVDNLSLNIKAAFSSFTLDINQDAPLDGVTAVFGPSGAGKSTLLRCIAGFETPRSGRIAMGRDIWFDKNTRINLPAWRRPVGYMFQDARLFPHLTVQRNIEYAAKRSLSGHSDIQDIIDAFALSPLLGRRPETLSGGERQRAALARTLATRPRLLLLDEPLSGLDWKRKTEILPFLKTLSAQFGIPTLIVSHDLDEVSQLADRMLVMANGCVERQGLTADVMSAMDFGAFEDRFETSSILDGIVSDHDARLCVTQIQVHDASITMPINETLAKGDKVRLRIRAQDVAIATEQPRGLSIRNALAGTVNNIDVNEATAFAVIDINIGACILRARITRAALEDLNIKKGMAVYALIKSVSFDHRLT